ncbi:MAG: hypothetical protein IK070_02780 [Clostridia bacterium]|nr:hypothetical protein [Clostridia bacterium]
MKKSWTISERRIIIFVCLVCTLIIVAGICLGIYQYNKNRMEFKINDMLPNGNGNEAKVILLAGQSNAAGCSSNEYLERNVSAEKYEEYKNGYDNVYINYYSSDINASNGFTKAALGQGYADDYFGPEVGLAEKLHELYPDELFFIVKFAIGGTNLFEEWLSPSSDGSTGYLYTNFVRYVNKSMKYLKSKGYNAKIEGLCWMQGESDSFSMENATGYKTNLSNFIGDVRNDFSKYAASDGIAFVDAKIADNPAYWVYCEQVNQSKQDVADMSDMNVLIDTNAEGLDCSQEPEGAPDRAHYDSLSQIKLGKLFAQHVAQFL